MSTYPVDIKTVNITTATTTTIFDGPARVLGLSWVIPTNVGVGKNFTLPEELKKLSKEFSRKFFKETFFRKTFTPCSPLGG